MKFFIPNTKPSEAEAAYASLVNVVKDQLRIAITPRRIYGMHYVHDKKRLHVQVGSMDPQQGRYVVCAILESKPYVVVTRTESGQDGLTMLINGDEVTSIDEFQPVPNAV